GRSTADVVIRIAQMLTGSHVQAPGVVHFRSPQATFRAETDLHMHVDGEPVSTGPQVEFRIVPQRLRVMTPAEGEDRLFTQVGALQSVGS
ncbi:MAG TPA: hypothetical protein VLD63_08240, partial [Anaerolineales bacterium]|nr:hypothetical protein [Anaerolineales bacterium]